MKLGRALILGVFLATSLPVSANDVVGRALVIDGDTIELNGKQYRLSGIDAPEAAQTVKLPTGGEDFFGRGAALVLRSLLQDGETKCLPRGERDVRGASLAVCFSGDTDVGAELVERGMAWTLPEAPAAYKKLETVAREKRHGFWRDQWEQPWLFRRRMQVVADASAPDRCAFKGIVDQKDNRIYFAPWSPWYDNYKVEVQRGDKWLCSEAEAIAAGWKAPLFLMESIISGVYNP